MAALPVQAISSAASASATTKALTFSGACAAGNAIIVALSATGSDNGTASMASSPALTWTKLREHLPSTATGEVNLKTAVWIAYGTTASTYTVTYTPTAAAQVSIQLMEVSGLLSSAAQDTGAEGHSFAALNPIVSGNSATLAQASEFVVGMYGTNDSNSPASVTYTPYAAWPCTQITDGATFWVLACEYETVAATTAVASAFSLSGGTATPAQQWDSLVQTFKIAAVAAPFPPWPTPVRQLIRA